LRPTAGSSSCRTPATTRCRSRSPSSLTGVLSPALRSFPTRLTVALAVALALAGPARACATPKASPAYLKQVDAALRSRTDVWGNELLAAPGGPTYAGASRFLAPLLYARGPGGKPLTGSGVYYLAFGVPDGSQGTSAVALHVADGSQILWRKTTGPALTVWAGPSERYGSCLARLTPARLAQGWLPMLETGYRNAAGVHLHQESFAASGPGGALASYVHLDADRSTELRVTTAAGTTAVTGRTLYLRWAGHGRAQRITPAEYTSARDKLIAFWTRELAGGASISVPEPRVENALKALLVQDLDLTWRYSVGNPYEEFSFPESVDVSQVLGEFGFADDAKSILRTSFTRAPVPYPNWKMGERLTASAEEVQLEDDDAFLAAVTPVLGSYVTRLDASFDGKLLGRERYSSDIPDEVYGLHSQTVVWEGLEGMARVWAAHGDAALARRALSLADRLEPGLRSAVATSERALPDGSLFLPVSLLDDEQPYDSLTDERLGSYWNLVMPYALASGFFAPGSRQARGSLRYMELHGSRLLGLVRAGGYALYGLHPTYPTSGTDEVYGINVARFLGDLDEPDELVLSLYGDLAAAMTPNTFVSGEGATVEPLAGERYRAMYLPPNSASNAAFLETLRQLLVHETRNADSDPVGLQLAYATPRGWLEPGKRIAVSNLPTSFGPLSYSIAAGSSSARVTVDVPSRTTPRTLSLRLRLPPGRRIRSVALEGHPYARFDRATGTIDLSGREGTLELLVDFS
jgi:hypothetical protein